MKMPNSGVAKGPLSKGPAKTAPKGAPAQAKMNMAGGPAPTGNDLANQRAGKGSLAGAVAHLKSGGC